MAAPASRPVHPCLLSVFDGNTGGEHSIWAHLTSASNDQLPDLVTAQGSTLQVYSIDETTGKLQRKHVITDLAGSVCFLAPLKTTRQTDSLLIGFSGHPRLSIVSLTGPEDSLTSRPTLLMATTLVDLTQALLEHSLGSVTPLEQDLVATLEQKSSSMASLAVVLGGGVAVATLTLRYISGRQMKGWQASEPYILPLQSLPNRSKESIDDGSKSAVSQTSTTSQSVSHGFGDIVATCYLTGYLEPTLVLLHSHSDPGRTWPGRLGRPKGQGGTRYGLTATAISITVLHQRSAVLWSVEVPADAHALYAVGTEGCLVVCFNSVLEIGNAGRITSGGVLAVNGWAKSTCPPQLLDLLRPNPSPLPKLAVQLDGARLAFLQEHVALVSLRRGRLCLLQRVGDTWNMILLGHTLGAVGHVASLLALPFPHIPKGLWASLVQDKSASPPPETLSMGMIFAGSRLGDSSLLGYTLETGIALLDDDILEGMNGKKPKLEDLGSSIVKTEDGEHASKIRNVHVLILQKEEDALYAPTEGDDTEASAIEKVPDVIPPSEDEDEDMETHVGTRKRPRLTNIATVRSLVAMDSLTGLGPIGPGCEGPLSRPTLLGPSKGSSSQDEVQPIGGTAQIFPCGLGSSGSLALLTVPGRDDRTIVAEADCLNMQCLFNLPRLGVMLMGRVDADGSQGTTVLRIHRGLLETHETITGADRDISEVDLSEWCDGRETSESRLENAFNVLTGASLLAAEELSDDSFAVLVQMRADPQSDELVHAIVVLREQEGKLSSAGNHELIDQMGSSIVSATSMLIEDQQGGNVVSFGCAWSSGNATISTVGLTKTSFKTSLITGTGVEEMDLEEAEEDEASYYSSERITAMDLFMASQNAFSSKVCKGLSGAVAKPTTLSETDGDDLIDLSDEDAELYREDATDSFTSLVPSTGEDSNVLASNPTTAYVAVCRQSGALQVFELSDFAKKVRTKNKFPRPVWEAINCGQGAMTLNQTSYDSHATRQPRMHKMHASEIRFFSVGPCNGDATTATGRTFCLAVETNTGDFHLYGNGPADKQALVRIPLRLASRPSQEQARHQAKLRRKRIIGSANGTLEGVDFRHNHLHAFSGISGQDGLFAGLTRSVWIVSERGFVVALGHRSRHCAPAGGRPRPVTGFCAAPMSQAHKKTDEESTGFVTLHERIGRVGSQRLTFFQGITGATTNNGFFPGGGLCLEKVSLGVTVHQIQLVDDSSISSGDHPLYAVLVSRELELDQSGLNEDGVTLEERQRMSEEKDAELVKRQVEADLGGFDLEQEWVEEIERENCFEIDVTLGGAPPILKQAYSLWIVDAADSWNVVDSFQLNEVEHGITMKVMSLTEVNEEPGSNVVIPEDELFDTLFVTVGTGIVDGDGEDVASKGRALLFQVKRRRHDPTIPAAVELNLVYEKDILHGAVTSLSCLSCEGRKRLIIGAGSDVNVEQWGNDKLTQVGFFRANMQVLDIMLFKTFLLLSDAYDSLYFLVWRESDKSLTLLAKDYEPIPVYAAGIMSRGGSMSFVCHDDRQNLQFFQYAPGDAAARGGNKLVCRADVHMGAQTVSLQNHPCRSSLLINSATPTSTLEALKQQDTFFGKAEDDQRLAVHFGTTEGGLSSIVPLSEPVYWRLTALQSVMANALESDCALSQRAWRLYRRTPRRGGCRNHDRKKGVIDGNLVIQFVDLPLVDQEDLASAIGSTVDLILDNLLELRCASMMI